MSQAHSCHRCVLVHLASQTLIFWRRRLVGLSAVAIVLIITLSYYHTQRTTQNVSQVLSDYLRQIKEIINNPEDQETARGSGKKTIHATAGQSSEEPETKYFTKVTDADHYMYSAIVNLKKDTRETNATNSTSYSVTIVITSLNADTERFQCCVLFDDVRTPLVTSAAVHFNGLNGKGSYKARQYSCTVSVNSSSLPQKVTLAVSSSCPTNPEDYITILYPPRHPGGIALCGKISHSGGLDPQKIIEWFEIQRILGVDKILIYDLETSENVTRVFSYYQKLGILDLQPYELPGEPKHRSLSEASKHSAQFEHDETMVVLECRQRMGGYDYIISHDLDEMIIPRKNVTLKTFIQDHVIKYPRAAAFFFYTEFFLTTWQPTNPEEDLMVKRYRLTRVARWECYKYLYVTSRVLASITHVVYPFSKEFNSQQLLPDVAILHHYRQCPEDTWKTCNVESTVDNIMIRYTDLDGRVFKVRTETSTQPGWTPVKDKTTDIAAVKH